ncbi:DUF4832 domain-containing protein [Desertivirga xinjiangensis]|uniref:DUF4832 domain-containing protein n=1 Tax=Desertivirga xinjiangensis TaxID=539206 RepID=UPI0021090505|nr:DUF4832 domain-containing protein [Pedobacter xinjiangensis]
MIKEKKLRIFGFSMVLIFLFSAVLACKKSSPKAEPEPEIEVPVEEGFLYEPSTAIFPNTERGFTRTYSIYAEGQPLNLAQLKQLRNQNVTLIVVVFYFNTFKDKALSQAELSLIQANLDYIREAGLKGVLRFAYTDAIGVADASLATIEQHLDQLKPVFDANKDVIAFLQAGFIGAWGEWHSSSNGLTSVENQKMVLTKILNTLPPEIMVQVRTPSQKQQVFNSTIPLAESQAYTSESIARVGHHNDCFLSGGTNYGTYINIAAEKQYISKEGLYVPVGGETCPPEPGYIATCFEGRTEMKLLKWTYLNLDWYVPTIDAWKSSGCFDEFQRNLGYRLALVSAVIPEEVNSESDLKLAIKIVNNGYAPLYNRKNTSLILKNKASGTFTELKLAFDIRSCKPGSTIKLEESVRLANVPAGDYALYLRIADQAESLKNRIEYAVRLANNNVWVEENGGMNDLKLSLKIK